MVDASPLTSVLKQLGNQYGHFTCEVCLEKKESGYEAVFGKVTAIKAGDTGSIKEPVDFGPYVFAARRFELTEISRIIEEQSPKFSIGQYSFTFQNAQLSRTFTDLISSNNDWSDWPVNLIELRSSSGRNYIPPKALASHNTNRIFHDVFDGIEQYYGCQNLQQQRMDQKHALCPARLSYSDSRDYAR
jgi:hypothetical protein